jgi:hypothetical protein
MRVGTKTMTVIFLERWEGVAIEIKDFFYQSKVGMFVSVTVLRLRRGKESDCIEPLIPRVA